jgi:hypothetical protein
VAEVQPSVLLDDLQQRTAVFVVDEDRLAAIAARSDVVDRAGELDAQRTGYGRRNSGARAG